MTGRKWAYAGVILGFSASVTANVASTALKVTDVPLALRIPFAIFWPLATYVAIEVLARIDWNTSWSHRAIRMVLWGPVGAVAAFVSYLHQHHLMVLAGEPGLAQGFGPIAVDCLLFGMTATLIVTRPKAATFDPYAPSAPAGATQPMEPGIDWDRELQEWNAAPAPLVHPVSAPPSEELLLPVAAPPRTRASRGEIPPALRSAVNALISGDVPEVGPGASRAVIGRYAKVLRTLRNNPHALIDAAAEKVRPELVDEIRAAMREVAPR